MKSPKRTEGEKFLERQIDELRASLESRDREARAWREIAGGFGRALRGAARLFGAIGKEIW